MPYYSYGNRIYSINENVNTSNDIEVVIDSDIRKLIEVKQLVKSGDLKGAVERALRAGLESVAERIKRFQIEQSRPVRESVAGVEEDDDGVADSSVCPNCGQLVQK